MTICIANLLWIHYIFREFTWFQISVSRIHFQFNIFFANKIPILYLSRKLITNLLRFFFANRLEFTIFYANSHRIHFYFRKFTFNSLFSLRILYLFREFILNSLLFSWIRFKFTIFFANSLWIFYLFSGFKYHIEFASIRPVNMILILTRVL